MAKKKKKLPTPAAAKKEFNSLVEEIRGVALELIEELKVAYKNKAANRRARLLTLDLEHKGKEFRRASMDYDLTR
ncbi:MAG: hypothetical protein GY737_14010 [Desulfobacteraceae bacterium]|nr:hypothetical protein [Desulfobacteraceae bacterium]